MTNKEKVVLAFSGGLDTTYCAIYLARERGFEVYTALVNTGGFSTEELDEVEKKALALGVSGHTNIDVTEAFYRECVRFLIYGNVLRNNTYPLSVSAERVFQAKAIADHALALGADHVAHGSTGAGNDQVRFDLIFEVLAPQLSIITPIRDQKLSRQQEVAYLKKHGVVLEWEKARYSINKGLWGTSVGGEETLTAEGKLPEEAFPSQLRRKDYEEIRIGFNQGEPDSMNGEKLAPLALIEKLNKLASDFAIGRDVHVGDTIIGIKGRVGFEAPAPLILIKAHHLLEKHTLTKWQMYWKEQLANWYGMFLHEGQYLEPVMRNIEGFLEDSQEYVTGEVFITLHPYRFTIDGASSPSDLMSAKFGKYGEENNAWSGEDVKGFTRILSNSAKIFQNIHHD